MASNEPRYEHKLRYDPTTLAEGETVLTKWRELAVHETLVRYGFGDNDKWLRYAILLGQGSGLHSLPDWADRKREALRLAGIAPDDARVEAALTLQDEGVQALRWAWMRIFCSMEFAAYTALIEAFYQNCAKVEEPITDGISSIPDITIHLTVDGRENKKEAKERADYMLEAVAGMIAGKKSELKEDAMQRALKLRSELGIDLRTLIKEIREYEQVLFHGDEHLRQAAIEAAKPKAASGSIEELVFGKNKKQ